ncbi:MAG TPA: C-GCAxxG-C-C family (seleno)protein [Dysgonamonadaceae bacterium]|nr:C-GCAxxG-C-C family (seleno)protein [Dysgonamonadaceae bacterium]
MLKDQVKKYLEHELQYGDKRKLYHYNCTQAILHGANDYYTINLDPKALKLIIPFGGGMYTGNACGMLTGGIAAIGALFAEDMPSENLKLKEITQYWIKQFENEFKDINCSFIKTNKPKNEENCNNLILKAADILEGVIEVFISSDRPQPTSTIKNKTKHFNK